MMFDMESDTAAVLTRLDKLAALETQSRWQRLASAPLRIPLWRAASLASRAARRPIPFRARTVYGDRMRVYAPEFVSGHIYERTAFEVELTRTFLKTLKGGWTVYDVGAHFGYFTLLASRLVGESGSVHSFEPTPTTRRVLEHNTRHLANVTVENRAAWSSETQMDFNDLGIAFSAFNSAFSPRLDEEHASTRLTVHTTTLDSYAAEWGSPDFVKIDAESSEFQVIDGMSGLLGSKRPIVSVEVGDTGMPGVPSSREMIEQVLAHDYALVVVGPSHLEPGELKESYGYDNVLLAPSELVGKSRE